MHSACSYLSSEVGKQMINCTYCNNNNSVSLEMQQKIHTYRLGCLRNFVISTTSQHLINCLMLLPVHLHTLRPAMWCKIHSHMPGSLLTLQNCLQFSQLWRLSSSGILLSTWFPFRAKRSTSTQREMQWHKNINFKDFCTFSMNYTSRLYNDIVIISLNLKDYIDEPRTLFYSFISPYSHLNLIGNFGLCLCIVTVNCICVV